MHCTPLAQDLQRHAPAQRAAPNRRPRPVRTRAAPTGLTPRLHTAGVGGAEAPAWEGERRRRSRYAHSFPPLPPRRISAELGHRLPNTHTRATPRPTSRTCSRESRTEHAVQSTQERRSCVLMTPLMAYPQVPNATAEDASCPAWTAGHCTSAGATAQLRAVPPWEADAQPSHWILTPSSVPFGLDEPHATRAACSDGGARGAPSRSTA